MNKNIEELLEDLGIEEPERFDQLSLYELLNKVAVKWQSIKKDSTKSQITIFEASCKCKEECCSTCEKRWMGECQTSCYTFNFDCCECPKCY